MYKKPAFELPDELPGPEIFKDGYWHVTPSKQENKMSELPDLGIIQQKRIKMDDTELKIECIRQANYRLVADEKNTTADLIKVADDIYKFVTSSSGFPKAAEG